MFELDLVQWVVAVSLLRSCQPTPTLSPILVVLETTSARPNALLLLAFLTARKEVIVVVFAAVFLYECFPLLASNSPRFIVKSYKNAV